MFAYLLRTHREHYRADTRLLYTVFSETLTVTAYMKLSRINTRTGKIDEIALLSSDKGIFKEGN